MAQMLDQFVVSALQEKADAAHLLGVLVLGDLEHAWAWAALDLVLQARALARFEVAIATRAQAKVTVDQAQRRACRAGRMVRTEVAPAVFLRPAHDFEPGPRRIRIEAQRQELLVVAQLD